MNKVKDKILEVMLKVIIEELSLRGVEADKLLLKLIKLKYSSLLDSYISQVIKDLLPEEENVDFTSYDDLQENVSKAIAIGKNSCRQQFIDNLKEKYNINN